MQHSRGGCLRRHSGCERKWAVRGGAGAAPAQGTPERRLAHDAATENVRWGAKVLSVGESACPLYGILITRVVPRIITPLVPVLAGSDAIKRRLAPVPQLRRVARQHLFPKHLSLFETPRSPTVDNSGEKPLLSTLVTQSGDRSDRPPLAAVGGGPQPTPPPHPEYTTNEHAALIRRRVLCAAGCRVPPAAAAAPCPRRRWRRCPHRPLA